MRITEMRICVTCGHCSRGSACVSSRFVATVVPLLIGVLGDASSEVRAVAAQALGGRHEKSAEPALIKLLSAQRPGRACWPWVHVRGPIPPRALSEMIGNVPGSHDPRDAGRAAQATRLWAGAGAGAGGKTIGKTPGFAQTLDIPHRLR